MVDNPTDNGSASGSEGTTRRRFLAAQSLLVAGSVTGIGTGITGAQSGGPIQNTVTVDPDTESERAVSDQIYGRLCEYYESGTIYPGVYSQHLKNPTFFDRQPPEDSFWGPRTFYPAEDITRNDNVPFPWEPVSGDGVSFEQRGGGYAAVETTDYSRVSVDDARGGIMQKIVLPDFRTLEYDLSFAVRGEGVDTVTASIKTLDGQTLASADVDVTSEWTENDVSLELSEASGDQYIAGAIGDVDTPYGKYAFELTTEGSGHVDLDFTQLAAGDAIDGKFNPSTVELMREKNTTWLKWPGGNFTSQYNWRDGIGPQNERPARINHAWGGIESNLFGTKEYLELCEIADLEPRITIGWWDNPGEWATERQTTPQDAADWVEYVNGSQGTEMGSLRADHGLPQPADVTWWGVGNEVWGPWQRGSTQDASEYASGSDARIGFNTYAEAMREVDDSIKIHISGMDPGYQESNTPDPDVWNTTLLEESGDHFDSMNIHRYVFGIENAEERQAWYDTNGTTPIDYNEVMMMVPTQFEQLMSGLIDEAESKGLDDFMLNISEYGAFPAVTSGEPYPGPETMPGGTFVSGMLNAFIGQSDNIRAAAQTWVPVRMFPPLATEDYPPDPNPFAPAASVFGLYSAVFEDNTAWHSVETAISGASRTLPETGPRIQRMEDVPYLDAAAMVDQSGREVAAFLTNRNITAQSEVTVELGEEYADMDVELVTISPTSEERPLPHLFQTSWEEPSNHVIEQQTATVGADGTLELTLDPASVARLHVGDLPNVDPLPGHANPPASIDDDALLEDVDGNGNAEIADIIAYYNNRDSASVENNPGAFDFNDDGEAGNIADVISLFNKLF